MRMRASRRSDGLTVMVCVLWVVYILNSVCIYRVSIEPGMPMRYDLCRLGLIFNSAERDIG